METLHSRSFLEGHSEVEPHGMEFDDDLKKKSDEYFQKIENMPWGTVEKVEAMQRIIRQIVTKQRLRNAARMMNATTDREEVQGTSRPSVGGGVRSQDNLSSPLTPPTL